MKKLHKKEKNKKKKTIKSLKIKALQSFLSQERRRRNANRQQFAHKHQMKNASQRIIPNAPQGPAPRCRIDVHLVWVCEGVFVVAVPLSPSIELTTRLTKTPPRNNRGWGAREMLKGLGWPIG